jgi:hypothetical protein
MILRLSQSGPTAAAPRNGSSATAGAFPLGRIKANKWQGNCSDFGDQAVGVAGRHGDGRLGSEGEIPFDRLVNSR